MYTTRRISRPTLSYYSHIIDHCLSANSLSFAKIVHAQLIKVGFNTHTYVGNRYLDLYSRLFAPVDDIFKIFADITSTNTISWNICLKAMFNLGQYEKAHYLFDKMPERDVVSWNSIISGSASHGDSQSAFDFFKEMQNMGVRPSVFTYSIMISIAFNVFHGKELHGSMIRTGLSIPNLVLGNSLIDMYGKFGNAVYAFGVFLTMEDSDIITWNSLITGCCKSGYGEMALKQFGLMRSLGYSPDEFTCCAVITCCSHLRNLDKGKQIFAFCIKMGFLCNTIVSSATIDLFSKCNRLDDAVQLFGELDQWDSAVCDSMISSYEGNSFEGEALRLFVLALRKGIRPTEFTISSILSCISTFAAERGTQVHSLVVKLGLELDDIVCSSLVEMYANCGCVDYAMEIFENIKIRDLICWNTMIMGLTKNGRLLDVLDTFKELLDGGTKPDGITLAGVLLACSYGGFVDQGLAIFSSMQESYGISPRSEHYACIVELLCQGDMIDKAMSIIEAMPFEMNSSIWRSVLHACASYGNLKHMELVAEKLMELEPLTSFPYLVLARIYETRGQWENIIRVKNTMRKKKFKTVDGYSWIGIKNLVYIFEAEQLNHHGGEEIYLLLRLLDHDMENEGGFLL
ncbi:pentatricopeptide repeat-containing protein At1g43980, mitochondrial [Euphorbia lathyris]|uniref:pentatricopeptide repeat-containing protein At1g43980, mitochondrial n=1 Tax=Euphorbia lathyris TaxID=212925 RepID=UPI003313A6F4